MEEVCFPRGGTKPKRKEQDEKPKQKNLFNVTEVKKRKKQKVFDFPKEIEDNLHLNSIDLLAYTKIQPTMILLGCVKEIIGLTVKVQLSGTLYANVQINAISDKLTALLTQDSEFSALFDLRSIFKIGDFIPIQILELDITDRGNKRLVATTNPINVNFQNNCNSFRKGMLVWGAISEKLDHVYSIDLGVQNTRCILNINDVDEGIDCVEGKPLWLLIKNVQSSNSITTIMVTNLQNELDNYISTFCSLDVLCPGSCVEVTCTKVLKSGLEVTFFKDCTGYLNKVYLDKPQRNLAEFLNTSFKAYVLYKNPITKFTYFTMNPPKNDVEPEYEIGTVLKSKVIDSFSKGVIIQFKNSERGFVTFKRAIRSLRLKDNADLENVIKQHYTKGSTFDCRILDYSYMDRMYICTFEMDVIKEKYFSRSDLKVGEIVNGKIKAVKENGILVQVGMVECFATNEHLTNVKYSENVKLQFKVGKSVKARVLSSDSHSVKVTLKPALLEDHECLTSYAQANVNCSYVGVAVYIKPNMVLVRFYNDVKGIILDKMRTINFMKLLYQGQVITVTLVSKKDGKLVFSLGGTEERPNSKLYVGQLYRAVISNVRPEGLKITTNSFEGFVPMQHLCFDMKLSKLMLDFLKEGQELFGLRCLRLDNDGNSLFSMRNNSKHDILKSKTLKIGTIVRSFVKTYDKNGLKLDVFTKQGVVEVCVKKNNITDDKKILRSLKLNEGQPLLVKINSSIDENTYSGTARFSKVFNYDYNYSAVYLEKYLNDPKVLHNLSKGFKAIAGYKIGQKVEVRVTKIADIVCSVELKDGTMGIATKDHMLKNLKVGSTYTAIILFVNIADDVLEISFKPKIVNQKFEEDPKIRIDQQVFAKILMVRENLAICSIKHNGKKSIGFIPIKLNENDFSPDYDYYRNKDEKFKLIVYTKTDSGVIGFPFDLIKASKKSTKKRKLSENDKVDKESNKKAKLTEEDDESGIEMEAEIQEDQEMLDNTLNNDNTNEENETERLSVDGNHQQNKLENDNESYDVDDDEKTTDDKNDDNEINCREQSTKQVEKPPAPAVAKFKNPSMKSFFDTTESNANDDDSESDSDTNMEQQPKKKKLSKKERLELLKKEEEELRKIELSYADMSEDAVPQTADQFDRRLLAEPNSSALWIRYAAFHISNTEIDKARTVFRRALQGINPTLIEDHLNVWMAYINLEHMYGTKQTFMDVFNEAVKYNDDLRVYVHTINTLSNSQNVQDVDELIQKMVRKFRQEPKMYVEVAKVYYKQKRFNEARKLRTKALGTITERKRHIPLIVQFAKLEFDNEQDEYAETLFETILKDAPHRVDVWIVYVDQLIKRNKIDLARRVLQRAVGQKLKIAKMTSLCKKYVAFEKQYGDEDTRSTAEGILNEIFSTVKNKK